MSIDYGGLIRSPLFKDFPAGEIDNLLKIGRIHEIPERAMLFYEGDYSDQFSIILKGSVEIIKSINTPEERLLSEIGPGEFIGEASLLDPARRRTASARAVDSVTLLEITRLDFERLLQSQPEFAIRLMQEMNQRIRRLEKAIIQDLQEKNRRLTQAYLELEAAQAQIIEKERLESELALARRIQENNLLKELPEPHGWQVAAAWQPARSVSGDFYDFILYKDNTLKIIIADASGKGMPAALVVATTRSVLRTLAVEDSSPGETLARANDILFEETPPTAFVTCFFGELDLQSGRLTFANAGHCLPVWLGAHGLAAYRAVGMPLGMMPDSSYEERQMQIEPGEAVFLYSDGLIEAHDQVGDMFGVPRLLERLTVLRADYCLIDRLLDDLTGFTGVGEPEDDITCVLLKRLA